METKMLHGEFAISARTLGHPKKLYTPITVINLEKCIAAQVNAMWDTGAEYCIMSESLARALRIEFTHEVGSKGLTGSSMAKVGYACVSLVSGGGIMQVVTAIVADHVGGDEYSFIIGLNLISLGSLSISCTCIDTMLSFRIPSKGHVDYAEQADSDTPKGYFSLSSGKENAQFYYDNDALRLIANAVPEDVLKFYL